MPARPQLLKAALVALGLLSAGTNAHALVITTLAGTFPFGPSVLNYSQGASLFTYSGSGTLIGVRIELSGSASGLLTASNGGASAGTVTSMTDDVSFGISGLPFASLNSVIPTFSVPSFILNGNTTQTFPFAGSAPMVTVNLTAQTELAFYDSGMGAPASLPFVFNASEIFAFHKTGGDISGGSRVTGQGLVNVFYIEDDSIVPVGPVPEVSTALSAGCFALLGGLALFRTRRKL